MALISTLLLVALCTYTCAERLSVPDLDVNRSLVQEFLIKRLTTLDIVSLPSGLVKLLETRLRLSNPLNKTLTIHSIDARVDYGAKINDHLEIGVIHDQTPLRIHPHQQLLTPYINITLTGKLTTLTTLLIAVLEGNAHFSLYGFINFTSGHNLFFIQQNVTMLNITAHQEPKPEI